MHYTVIILSTPDVVQGTANHLLELVTLYRDEFLTDVKMSWDCQLHKSLFAQIVKENIVI